MRIPACDEDGHFNYVPYETWNSVDHDTHLQAITYLETRLDELWTFSQKDILCLLEQVVADGSLSRRVEWWVAKNTDCG